MKKPIIGITMGDPSGIGPEICVKALLEKQVIDLCSPIIIGDARFIKSALSLLKKTEIKINSFHNIKQADFSSAGIINILDLGNADPKKLKPGQVSAESGKASIEYVEKAIKLAQNGEISAIATGPINKEAINKAGYHFQGHTELFAKRTNTKDFGMMFVSSHFWLILATTHMPISKVSKSLTKEKVLNAIRLSNNAITKFRKKKPKIGVAGLNPHAGESGLFGDEEEKIIKPAIEAAVKEGINASGPYSPDIIFNMAKSGMFEVIVAMYHDQGLIPLKLLSFNKSVNLTVGLPIIRTSVDHGTGFDIVGKGWANPGSLIEAIKVASHLARPNTGQARIK